MSELIPERKLNWAVVAAVNICEYLGVFNKKVRKRAIVADIAKAALAVGIFALSLKLKKKKK